MVSFVLRKRKEYGLADSRYLVQDSAVWSIEAVTSFVWGPICLLIATLIFNRVSVYKDVLSLIVSTGQAYGQVNIPDLQLCPLLYDCL